MGEKMNGEKAKVFKIRWNFASAFNEKCNEAGTLTTGRAGAFASGSMRI